MGILWNDAASSYKAVVNNLPTLIDYINAETCHGE